jgi:hypothetical protein
MAKRIGANRMRRARAPQARRRHTLIVVAGVLLAAAGASLRFAPLPHGWSVPGIAPLAGRFLRPHASIVTSIKVVGGVHVTADDIAGRLGFHLPMPFSPMRKEPPDRWQRVSPWIAGVKLIGPHEGVVTVVITERVPVAIEAKPGVCFVDTAGAFIPFDPRYAPHLPLVSGLRDSAGALGRCLTNEDRGRLNGLLAGLTAFYPGMVARVTQARFGSRGAVSLWLEASPTEIALDGNNLGSGLERLVELLPSVRGDSGFPGRIDLSCRNLAFVTTGAGASSGAGKVRPKG